MDKQELTFFTSIKRKKKPFFFQSQKAQKKCCETKRNTAEISYVTVFFKARYNVN